MPKLRASSGLIEKTSTKDLNVISGDTSATSTTVADADRVLLNDNGTMVQVAVPDLAAYFDDEITAMPNLVTTGATTVGALNSGSITSGVGTIDSAEDQYSLDQLAHQFTLENEDGSLLLENDSASDDTNYLLLETYALQTQSTYANNTDLDTEAGFDTSSTADDILDFTERNPFGEVDF